MQIRANLSGLSAVVSALQKLKRTTAGRIARKALGKASLKVLQAARATAPKRSGTLKQSLGRVTRTYKAGVTLSLVGPRKGFRKQWKGKYIDPVKYMHLAEDGRRALTPRKVRSLSWVTPANKRVYAKRVAAYAGSKFLARAEQQTRKQAERLITTTVVEELDKNASRA